MLAEVEQEIAKLQSVANALRGIESSQTRSGPTTGTSHRMSAATRRKISLTQKARWAKQKPGAQSTKGKRVISTASRRKMAAAQRARWAKLKSQKKAA